MQQQGSKRIGRWWLWHDTLYVCVSVCHACYYLLCKPQPDHVCLFRIKMRRTAPTSSPLPPSVTESPPFHQHSAINRFLGCQARQGRVGHMGVDTREPWTKPAEEVPGMVWDAIITLLGCNTGLHLAELHDDFNLKTVTFSKASPLWLISDLSSSAQTLNTHTQTQTQTQTSPPAHVCR